MSEEKYCRVFCNAETSYEQRTEAIAKTVAKAKEQNWGIQSEKDITNLVNIYHQAVEKLACYIAFKEMGAERQFAEILKKVKIDAADQRFSVSDEDIGSVLGFYTRALDAIKNPQRSKGGAAR